VATLAATSIMNVIMTGRKMATMSRISVLRLASDSFSRGFTSAVANEDAKSNALYLHVGPSGDCWTGSSIFAAKHLQPDYIKSIPLHPPHHDICADTLIEHLEEDARLARELYDTEALTTELLDQVRGIMEERGVSNVKR
jgi:hypothetical protein